MPKQYLTVRVEIDIYEDGEYRNIESVLPVDIRTHETSSDDLKAVHEFLRTDDDADFEFMWDLRAHIGNRAHNGDPHTNSKLD